jgi:hypothetical protein
MTSPPTTMTRASKIHRRKIIPPSTHDRLTFLNTSGIQFGKSLIPIGFVRKMLVKQAVTITSNVNTQIHLKVQQTRSVRHPPLYHTIQLTLSFDMQLKALTGKALFHDRLPQGFTCVFLLNGHLPASTQSEEGVSSGPSYTWQESHPAWRSKCTNNSHNGPYPQW